MAFKGKKHTEETKQKIRLSKLGIKRKPFSKEWKEKLRKASLDNKSRTGQVRSVEERLKTSLALRGENHPLFRFKKQVKINN